MAKQGAIAQTTLSVDNAAGAVKAIKGDIPNWDVAMPYNPWVVTGVDGSSEERLMLLADLSGTLNSIFNPSADQAHQTLSGDLRVARTLTIVVGGATLSEEVFFTDYKLTRAASAELTGQHPFVLASGDPAWT
jgi:hypothetical protein